MGGPGEPRPGGCGPRCPGTANTRGWAVPVPPVGGGRWGPRRDGYRNGRTGTGPTPTRGTGTMVSPGPPLPPLSLSLSEGAERDRDRDRRHGTRRARDAPVPVPIRPPGSPCRREGRGPRGWWEVARAGLCMSLCPCVSRPRVSRVSPAVPRCPLTPQCSCPLRSPSSGGPVPTSPRLPVLVVPVCPPAVPVSLRCPCPHGQGVSLGGIFPMILVSPGPHTAHPHSPRGSCVPMFPQSPVLMVPMSSVSLPVPVASPCPHGPDIPTVLVSPWSPFAAVPISPVFPQHLPRVPTLSPRVPRRGWRGASARPRRWRS